MGFSWPVLFSASLLMSAREQVVSPLAVSSFNHLCLRDCPKRSVCVRCIIACLSQLRGGFNLPEHISPGCVVLWGRYPQYCRTAAALQLPAVLGQTCRLLETAGPTCLCCYVHGRCACPCISAWTTDVRPSTRHTYVQSTYTSMQRSPVEVAASQTYVQVRDIRTFKYVQIHAAQSCSGCCFPDVRPCTSYTYAQVRTSRRPALGAASQTYVQVRYICTFKVRTQRRPAQDAASVGSRPTDCRTGLPNPDRLHACALRLCFRMLAEAPP